jgi:hypothetical protein
MIKYPKTPRLPAVLDQFDRWRRHIVVISEKLDGANVAVGFDGPLLSLQSRGHVLRGGPREKQFDLFKQWAYTHHDQLFGVLGSRYMIFGEWLYAKHRIFYDALPDYFVEYDVYDKEEDVYLSTDLRKRLIGSLGLPAAPILHQGPFDKVSSFAKFIGPSHFKTRDWKKHFKGSLDSTDNSLLMEGVYVKIETGTEVVGRLKLPRPDFEKIRMDDNDWLHRPIIQNRCKPGL